MHICTLYNMCISIIVCVSRERYLSRAAGAEVAGVPTVPAPCAARFRRMASYFTTVLYHVLGGPQVGGPQVPARRICRI